MPSMKLGKGNQSANAQPRFASCAHLSPGSAAGFFPPLFALEEQIWGLLAHFALFYSLVFFVLAKKKKTNLAISDT